MPESRWETIQEFLRDLGAKKSRSELFYLDGFDREFYLAFDAEECPENPEFKGTCDVYIVPVGEPPACAARIRLKENCTQVHVFRLLTAMGIERFSETTKTAFYGSWMANPLR